MGDMADMYDYAYDPDDEWENVTCKYCGEEGLIWDKIDDKWVLLDPVYSKLHQCNGLDGKLKELKEQVKKVLKK